MLTKLQGRGIRAAAVLSLAVAMGACTQVQTVSDNLGNYLNFRNSFLDPSQVGRFDKAGPWSINKPVTWPILDQLDMIDEPNEHWTMATDPVPSDLVVEQKEYIVGEGDIINVSVYELVTPGLMYTDQKQVNEVGMITLTNLGQVKVSGLTPSEIEKKIGDIAVEKGFLLAKGNGSPGPQVSVQLYQSRARVFSALGQVTGPGTYNIIGTDFRLLEALALAHDITGGNAPGMDYLYVIRPVKGAGIIPSTSATQPATAPASNPLDKLDNLEKKGSQVPVLTSPVANGPTFVRDIPVVTMADLGENRQLAQASPLDAAIGVGSAPATRPATPATPAGASAVPPNATATPVMGAETRPGMIYVDGKWVDMNPSTTARMSEAEAQAAASGMGLPRVIRIPINKLKEGDPRYNIVIRPGDIINVPNIEPGEFYLLGHVGRPGVYSLTGRKITLKQAVAASGGLDALAIPRRCDLIRRIGNTEITVQVDLQRIFDGEQPDIFLKSNDLVNVGTDFVAPFLAVTRNAYRASYGWGFIYDRNLYNQPVITQSAH